MRARGGRVCRHHEACWLVPFCSAPSKQRSGWGAAYIVGDYVARFRDFTLHLRASHHQGVILNTVPAPAEPPAVVVP